MQVSEGAVHLDVPEQDGTADADVFFNPVQELNRDLTVAVLRAYRERRDVDSYLDAMAASGIRGLRAAREGYEVTACDVDPEAVELAEKNFEANDLPGECLRADANAHMHEQWYDVVDIDPFGTPIPFADAAFNSARHLLCVTATDTAPLCGAHFGSGVRKYSTVPRNTDFHAEMGVRVLLSALVRTGARYDVAATPVLTHATNHYVRTYLELDSGAKRANAQIDELGYVDWCPQCLWRESSTGLIADPHASCPNCDANVKTAGPLYLGHPHDREFVASVREQVTDEMGSKKRALKLLDRLEGELDTPTHYDQHKLYKSWTEPAIALDDFFDLLEEGGFEASRTHYGGTTFKSDASVSEIESLVVD
ncbi:tRNA (guanine(26)-N(2))-dimethyltransferase [Natronomonas sp. EA1]|uniref:tRNA (guanine(26)-N(2))-dimethyltransferase n=1 Tax=Natronomonas sp. EA1 TaxID=3421655 RepID=UPI003EBB3139